MKPRLKAPTPQRSAIMRAIKSKNTGPERAVRKLLWPIARGYRLHAKELPGRPDVVYRKRKLAIFVHGCFWHGHGCRRGGRTPKTNAAFWRGKIARSQERDAAALKALRKLRWRCAIVFECELTDEERVARKLRRAVEGAPVIASEAKQSSPGVLKERRKER